MPFRTVQHINHSLALFRTCHLLQKVGAKGSGCPSSSDSMPQILSSASHEVSSAFHASLMLQLTSADLDTRTAAFAQAQSTLTSALPKGSSIEGSKAIAELISVQHMLRSVPRSTLLSPCATLIVWSIGCNDRMRHTSLACCCSSSPASMLFVHLRYNHEGQREAPCCFILVSASQICVTSE